MTEKTVVEEDLKGLEKEIDAAVDRLFVEKGGEPLKSPSAPSPLPGTLGEMEREIERKMTPPAPSISSTAPSSIFEFETGIEKVRSSLIPDTPQPLSLEAEGFAPSPSRPIEKLETQLLSLEWEITKENLGRTVEEILVLRGDFRENPDISAVLNRMVEVANYMIQNEEGIRPHLIQFLLDSKETIKLLMRKDTENDIATYKKLAHSGIEARFSCFEELQGVKPKPSSMKTEEAGERARPSLVGPELEEKIIRRIESFSDKLNEMIEKMNRHLSAHEKPIETQAASSADEKSLKTKITVFQMGEKLLGVESDKVFKLFKVPVSLRERLIQPNKVRLNGLEVRIVGLENFLSISEEDRGEERQILILKRDGEYKGLMVDRVLNRLSGPLEQGQELNEYLLGMIRWTHQGLPIKVPILNFEIL